MVSVSRRLRALNLAWIPETCVPGYSLASTTVTWVLDHRDSKEKSVVPRPYTEWLLSRSLHIRVHKYSEAPPKVKSLVLDRQPHKSN